MFRCAEKRRELPLSARIKHPMTNNQSMSEKNGRDFTFPQKVPGAYVPGTIYNNCTPGISMICLYDSTIFDKCTTAIF